MRRDMLSELGAQDEGDVKFGIAQPEAPIEVKEERGIDVEGSGDVDWESMVPGTKRVLSMDVSLSWKRGSGLMSVAKDTSHLPPFAAAARTSFLSVVCTQVHLL